MKDQPARLLCSPPMYVCSETNSPTDHQPAFGDRRQASETPHAQEQSWQTNRAKGPYSKMKRIRSLGPRRWPPSCLMFPSGAFPGLLLFLQVPPPFLLRREAFVLFPFSLQPLVLELLIPLLPLQVRQLRLALLHGLSFVQRLLFRGRGHPQAAVHAAENGGMGCTLRAGEVHCCWKAVSWFARNYLGEESRWLAV